jgi:hypothetical protein
MPGSQVAHVANYDFGAPISGLHLALYAAATLDPAGANNAVVYTARQPGVLGNLISLVYAVAGLNTPLTIGVVGNAITVNVATDGAGAATSTANQVRAAIAASTAANLLVSAANATGNDGTGVVAAVSATLLTGGAEHSDTARVLKFRMDESLGGKITFRIDQTDACNDISATIVVSEDGLLWFAITAQDNGLAFAAVTVKRSCRYDGTFTVRPRKDKYWALAATGGTRGLLQIRESLPQIVRI